MDEDQVTTASADSATVSRSSTPTRVAANIGRRRRKRLSLARTIPSPGHSVRMAHIYQTTKSSLTSPGSPSGLRTPNLNRLRISATEETPVPSSSMDTVETMSENPFDPSSSAGGQTPTNSPYLPHLPRSMNTSVEAYRFGIRARSAIAQELISSGFSSPIPSVVAYPMLKVEDSPGRASHLHDQTSEKSSWPSSGSGSASGNGDGEVQYLMFHGVPLPEPMTEKQLFGSGNGKKAQRADAWLDHFFEDDTSKEDETRSMGDRTKLEICSTTPSPEKGLDKRVHKTKEAEYQTGKGSRPDLKLFARSDSDKENWKPTDPGSSSPDRHSPQRTLRRVRLGAVRSILGSTPQPPSGKGKSGALPNISATRFQPMKRPSKSASAQPTKPNAEVKVEKAKSATYQPVSEDDIDVPLTPDVEIYRKRNRPKRTRCPSYFDEDIFQDLPDQPTSIDGSAEEDEAQSSPVHGDGRKILGESAAQAYLTKSQPFCKEAENYDFKGV